MPNMCKGTRIYLSRLKTRFLLHLIMQIDEKAGGDHIVLLLSSEDAGHRDWRNVRKNNLQNTAKEPEKPTTTISFSTLHSSTTAQNGNWRKFIILKKTRATHKH